MNIKLPEYLNGLLKKIWEETKPVTIFIYGSLSRNDFEKDSDYEIGVIYKKDKKVSRQELKDLHNFENIKIYPFIEEELKNSEIDTPFPKTIYLQTLLDTGFVLYGQKLENIIENQKITKEDLIESVGFCLGRAYAAVVSSRQKDWIAVRDNFTKSAFYGLQILIFVKTKKLIFSYKEIEKESIKLVDKEYFDLINHVIEIRKGDVVIDTSLLYKNISFLNKVVLKSIKD